MILCLNPQTTYDKKNKTLIKPRERKKCDKMNSTTTEIKISKKEKKPKK